MPKRKSRDLPDVISFVPNAAETSDKKKKATGPFAVSFSSGFHPGEDADCRWQAYKKTRASSRRSTHVVVARTVRNLARVPFLCPSLSKAWTETMHRPSPPHACPMVSLFFFLWEKRAAWGSA